MASLRLPTFTARRNSASFLTRAPAAKPQEGMEPQKTQKAQKHGPFLRFLRLLRSTDDACGALAPRR
jgi:hypothetical protein